MFRFLFLDALTLKLKIIINILPTDRPKIILPTARKTKNLVAFAWWYFIILREDNNFSATHQ